VSEGTPIGLQIYNDAAKCGEAMLFPATILHIDLGLSPNLSLIVNIFDSGAIN
jgi:hypothetical protein